MSKQIKDDKVKAPKSSFFREALRAVKNMRNVESEPLPGRHPSKAFFEALRALWEIGDKKKE